jgi:phosphomannomutase
LQAPLAGEMSGHIFFGDRWYGFDDAIYVAVRLLGILARSGDSLADIANRLPVMFNTPELRIDCDEVRKFAIVAEIAERLRRRRAEVIDIDGVRVKSADGWWLVRASNTQAVIVARAESTSADGLQRLKGEITRELAESGLEVKLG